MSSKGWKEIYRKLVSNKASIDKLETHFLFDLASQAAVSGDYETKRAIYEEFIFAHPRASQNDKTRVFVYRCDQERRTGRPDLALNHLESLMPPSDISGKAEYLQAVGQCELMLYGPAISLKTQRKIADSVRFQELAVDKQLYYLGTMVDMKIKAKQLDDEFNGYYGRYRNLINSNLFKALKPAFKKREISTFHSLEADLYELKQDFRTAAKIHADSFKEAPAIRDKVCAALRYLWCVWKADPHDNSLITRNIALFFKNNKDKMQATDIHALQEKYNYIKARLH